MNLHITELILWAEEQGREPVVIEFPTSKVAVITGWSETGKSSIPSIIDYVLGSERCTIPIGVVRETVGWYGLRLETDMGRIRVARRKPDENSSSNDYEVLAHDDGGRDSKISPTRNRHLDQFKSLMDTLSGLSDLPIAPGEYGKGYSGPASFRDMAAFNFLPQHIVANPFTLFYKTDTTEHREKLRRVFPVVLGAKTNEQLLLEHRLSGLHTEEKRLGAEIRRRKASIETWRSQISGSYLRAQELNLLPPGELPGSTSACVAALRQLATSPNQALLRSPASTTQEAVGRLEKFRSQEEVLDRQLGDARRQLRQIRALDSTIAEYAGDLFRERDRLKGFDWFRNATRGEHECPVCGTLQSSAGAAIEELRESLEDLEKLASSSVVTRPRLDTELLALETRIRTVEQQLFGIRRIRQELETEAENTQSAGQRLEDVYSFIGGVRQALESIKEVDDEDGIGDRHRKLLEEIRVMEEQLDAIRKRFEGSDPNELISDLIQEHAEFMGLGHSDLRPMIDTKELNVRFLPVDSSGDSKGDFLWEIGSGANWMGYHLAAMLALHEFFASRTENPVPNFLVIDQPSQVYFPSDTFREAVEESAASTIHDESSNVTSEPPLPSPGKYKDRSSDLVKTRKIFELLATVRLRSTLNLQIIVLEHADERTWTGLEGTISKVRDWRESGERLIPSRG